MQTHVEALWEAVEQKQYSKIPEIIQTNPNEDLVNSLNPHPKPDQSDYISSQTLAMRVLAGHLLRNTPGVLSSVLSDPKINLKSQDSMGCTLVEYIIESAPPEAITLLKDNPEIILDGDRLAYSTARDHLKRNEEELEAEEEGEEEEEGAEKDEKLIAFYNSKIKDLKEITSMLRDITILHAIATDDAHLMKRLDDEGGKMAEFLGELGNNLPPTALLKEDGNIRKLFDEERDKSLPKIRYNSFLEKYKELQRCEQMENAVIEAANQQKLDTLKESHERFDEKVNKFNKL